MKIKTTYVLNEARAGYRWLAFLGLLGSPFAMGAAASLSRATPFNAQVAMAACVALMLVCGFALTRLGSATAGTVEIDETSVRFTEHKRPDFVLERSRIRSAQFTPAVGRRPATVRLLGENERELAWIGVHDHAAGDRVLARLGLGAETTTAKYFALARWASAGGRGMLAAIVAGLALAVTGVLLSTPALIALSVLPVLAGSAYFLPASVVIGADGLLHKTRLSPRFYAWADVDGVEPYMRGVVVRLRSGERVEIPTTSRGRMLYEYERVAQAALVTRANDALRAFERGDVPDIHARVARGGRTKDEWVKSLLDREGTFRQAPLRSDDLWRVVESPTSMTSARAGAAVVLAQEASADDRARLRIAADTCAEPRLRVVLDRAATGADVTALLDDVDDHEAEREA